jgi:TonB family protein
MLNPMALWRILLFTAAAAAQTAPSPQDPADGVYRVGAGVSGPALIHKIDPEYSDEARRACLEGDVVLSVVVGTDGLPSGIRVQRAIGMGLDENAVAAVSAWRFKPGMKNGQPVAVQANIEVNFRMMTNSDWYLKRAFFQPQPGVSNPVIRSAPYPAKTQDPLYATFRLEVRIDERGVARDVKVVFSSDHTLDEEVLHLIGEWRFQAAEKNGIAVAASGQFEFSHGAAPGMMSPMPRK